MTRYRLSPRAQRDLQGIWDYTSEHWDEAQAERYVDEIRRAVEAVAAEPSCGRSCDEVRAGYFKFLVASHVLFYRKRGEIVEVIRILHQRMDFERHL